MADILDQSEVDALLNAASSGDIDDAASSRPTPSNLGPDPKDVSLYDFKRPERVSKEQMRALQSIHEGFARNFGAALSTFLRTIVETRVATIEQLTYSEFIHSLPSPTCFNLLTAEPLEGQLCLELSPLIVYPIVDRLLGGTNTEIFIPQRPLTSIEMRLINRIIERALVYLAEAWSDLVAATFKVAGTESNPHLVQIVAPNEVVVVLGFEIKIGARAGTMSICIPFNVIEPVIGKLTTQTWAAYSRGAATDDQTRHITANIQRASLDTRAYLGETKLTIQEFLSLGPGDIVRLDKLVGRDFILRVEGRNKFAGRIGQLRGSRAVQIIRQAQPTESL
ncbi:MAG: flagellar motor switch protein FliM [Planctomycetota bacterium]